MKTKHTPGPWRVELGLGDRERHSHEAAVFGLAPVMSDGVVAYVAMRLGVVDDIVDEANARLIAAAPDLAAALREYLAATIASADEWTAADGATRVKMVNRCRLAKNAAHAALAKAGL